MKKENVIVQPDQISTIISIQTNWIDTLKAKQLVAEVIENIY